MLICLGKKFEEIIEFFIHISKTFIFEEVSEKLAARFQFV